MEKIVLIGNGGHSKVIQDLILVGNHFQLFAILDDQFKEITSNGIIYAPVSYITSLAKSYEFKLVIAIGNNTTRKKLVSELEIPHKQYATLIHPTAIISSSVKLGQGTVVMPNVVINADTVIGNHVIINSSSVIEHDNSINDFAHIGPNATLTGSVTVGEGTQIGAAASVIPNAKIGSWCTIGAGSTVINHIPSYSKAVGGPAKVIEKVR